MGGSCKHAVLAVILWAGYGCVRASDAGPGDPTTWDQARIEAFAARAPELLERHSVPGIAVVLIEHSVIRWSSGFGVAALGGADVTPGTIFQVASLGKPVFAHALARLAQSREWTLQDPVSAWLSPEAYPPDFASLSAAELLSHTGNVSYDAEHDRLIRDDDLDGAWQYSGAGYALLQRWVERAEGRSWLELADSLLLASDGLASMSWVRPASQPVAHGHDRSGNLLDHPTWTEANVGSSLYSSADDYAEFMIQAATAPHGRESWERLTTPQTLVREDLSLFWGLGWALHRRRDGSTTAFHWGSNPGFKSLAMFDATRKLGLVILTNGDNGLELAEIVVQTLDPVRHGFFEFHMLHPDD